jgi:phage virion morphogenesis protein
MKAKELIRRLQRVESLKRSLPDGVGTLAKNFFKKNFRKQGFDNNGVEKWKPRKRKDKGRAILVKTGNLRNSIRVKNATFNKITIATDVDYANVHNSGLRAGRGKGFKMPKRQFMGESNNLNKEIKEFIERKVKQAILGK